MQLKTSKNKVEQTISVPGLMSGQITFHTQSATGSMVWTGPQIPVEVWHQILAFFRHTYNENKSESQVRLYVNTTTNSWAAWAYPQDKNSGMTTREIENEDAIAQRAQFLESEGWLYFGTVHHHCAAQAFQSGTDLHNEDTQDGLHITIGKMDSEQYDMHARFYFDRLEFNPDMSEFWDIGEYAVANLPAQVWDLIARHQMTLPAPLDTEIPSQWLANLLARSFLVGNGSGSNGGSAAIGFGSHSSHVPSYNRASIDESGHGCPENQRKELALELCRRLCIERNIPEIEIDAMFECLNNDPAMAVIWKCCQSHLLSVRDVLDEWIWSKKYPDAARNQSERVQRTYGTNTPTSTTPPTLPTTPQPADEDEAFMRAYGCEM